MNIEQIFYTIVDCTPESFTFWWVFTGYICSVIFTRQIVAMKPYRHWMFHVVVGGLLGLMMLILVIGTQIAKHFVVWIHTEDVPDSPDVVVERRPEDKIHVTEDDNGNIVIVVENE